MNGLEQAKAYAQADFSEPHENFLALFRQRFSGDDVEGNVLDLGCGAADISIRFARQYARCQVLGVDGAQAMLHFAEQAVKAAMLVDRIRLMLGYLPTVKLPKRHYAAIISNSLLHHLKAPAVLWDAIRQYGASGTRVFIMDLMRPPSLQAAKHTVTQYAADEPAVLQHDFYASLLAAYTVTEVVAQLQFAGLGQLQVKAVSDRHLVVTGIL